METLFALNQKWIPKKNSLEEKKTFYSKKIYNIIKFAQTDFSVGI